MKGKSTSLRFILCSIGFVIVFCNSSQLLAQKTAIFKLSSKALYNIDFSDSIQAFSNLSDLNVTPGQQAFLKSRSTKLVQSNENGAWLSFNLHNESESDHFLYLRFCQKADTVLLFDFNPSQKPSLLSSSGSAPPSSKIVNSPQVYLPAQVPAHSKTLFVVYIRFPQGDSDPHFTELYLSSAQEINHAYQKKAAFQFFFAGFILLLSIISLIASILLKNRALNYYALLMPFSVPYFLQLNNMNGYLLELIPWLDGPQQANLAILFEVLFAYLFISEYLALGKRASRFKYFYASLTLISLIALVYNTWLPPSLLVNLILALWLLSGLGITVFLSWKGSKSAKILLLSFSVLILGALLLTLRLSGLLLNFELAAYSFQIGTLFFSLILFYALASRINFIQKEKLKAEGVSKMKTEFFQDISHELRTPLSLVIDPIEKVLVGLPEGTNRNNLTTAHKASKVLLNLVNQILDLGKIESIPVKLNLEWVEITSSLGVLVGGFQSLAEEKGIDLSFNSDVGDFEIALDSLRLEQIVNNLISNALKFTPMGGSVLLNINHYSSDFIELSVQDTGYGISEKSLPHIFDRYFQASENRNRSLPGTGIGLALTKALVEQHQGSISVSSKVGEGSRIRVLLPTVLFRDEPKEATIKKDIPETKQAVQTEAEEVVLVIEDHPLLRDYLVEQLSKYYQVLDAANGEIGLALAQEHMPDVVISDLMVPLLDGYEITKSLKSDARTSHIPIILLTAKASQEAKNKGLELGADDYLMKPFNSEELLLRIANLLKLKSEWRKSLKERELPQINKELLNKVDREFLENLDCALAEHFGDASFSVQDLAAAAAMSKTHLNRKLNALLELSASKLIQNYRLEKAKLLLESKEGNVSELALLCGFNSTTYFVKCFKDKYGLTPGSFL